MADNIEPFENVTDPGNRTQLELVSLATELKLELSNCGAGNKVEAGISLRLLLVVLKAL